MSTEQQPLDPTLVEQTKQQIRSLVAEIAQLAKADVAPEEFYGEFLNRIVSALAAVGGAVWTVGDDRRLALQYQINYQQSGLRENEQSAQQHARLLYKAMSTTEGLLVPPHSGAGDEAEGAANPSDHLLVLGPLRTDLESVGVVEVFQRPESSPQTQRGYLRFLLQMCELAADFLKSHQLRHFSDRQMLWTQLEDFTRRVHASLDPRETAYTIANEGRRLIECDRLSVAIRQGNRCRVEAISGQDLFDKRSNVVRMLGDLATAVVRTEEPIWYTGDTSNMAPQVEEAVQQYVDEAHSKTVAVLPLMRPPVEEEDDPRKRERPEPPVGALIVEQIEDSRVLPTLIQRVEVVSRHSGPALANALEHNSLFLMPVWRTLGKMKWLVRARTLPKTISVTAAIVALILFLALWPADFELHSRGSLEPAIRRDVFARSQGVVDELSADHGDIVTAGAPLAQLRNTDLQVAVTDVTGQMSTARERILSIQRTLVDADNLGIEERTRLTGELAELNQKLESLKAQLALYEEKRDELAVRAPIDGVVVTWDLRRRLIHRPVERGQVLMRVADPRGPWQLELDVPEDRMGHIVRAQRERLEQLRRRLGEVLREQSPETDASTIERQVEEVANEDLSQRLRELLGAELIDPLHEGVRDLAGLPSAAAAEEDQSENGTGETPVAPDSRTAETPVAPDSGTGETPVAVEGLTSEQQQQLANILQINDYLQARAELESLRGTVESAAVRQRIDELLDDGLDARLPVTFILATDPETEHVGRVQEIHLSAEVQGEEGNVVMVKVDVDKEDLPHLRPGASVTAKIYCGRRSIGYTWFHDLLAFIHSRILFRYF